MTQPQINLGTTPNEFSIVKQISVPLETINYDFVGTSITSYLLLSCETSIFIFNATEIHFNRTLIGEIYYGISELNPIFSESSELQPTVILNSELSETVTLTSELI